jgi:O-antigen ligase
LDSSGRFEIWQNYIKVIEKRPVTGVGFDLSFWQDPNVQKKYDLVVEFFNAPMDPHNIFVSNAVRLGLVGLALYLFILYQSFSISWVLIRRGKDEHIKRWALALTAALLGYLSKGMFDESLSHVPANIFYIIMAMQTVLWKLNQENSL